MPRQVVFLIVVAQSCMVATPVTSRAGVTFLGPTPYLSKSDSPFPVDGSNPNFFLEDFEPDQPCVPGGSTICGAIPDELHGIRTFLGGGGLGSSVDADDGVIDGFGNGGISASSVPISISGSNVVSGFRVEFDFDELGYYPNAVGLVLTEGVGQNSKIFIYDQYGNEAIFQTDGLVLLGDSTSDDRFVGFTDSNRISALMFIKTSLITEPAVITRFDHLQYGLLIPEPNAGGINVGVVIFTTILWGSRKRILT